MVALAAKRRGDITDRWIRGGKLVGELEAYLKGGESKGVGESRGGREVIGAESEEMGKEAKI